MRQEYTGPTKDRRWLAPLGLCIVCLFLLPAAVGSPWIQDCLIAVAGTCALIATGMALALKIRRRRDPYDLGLLREVHEENELSEVADQVPSADVDKILCLCCGNEYSNRFPVCPHCKGCSRRSR